MRRGAALPMMVFVLAMTSALAVSGAFVARQMAATAADAARGALLEPEADAAISDALVSWDSLARADQGVGSSVLVATRAGPILRSDVWVTRLGPTTFWFVAEARALTRPRLTRRLGLVVHLTNAAPALVSERAWSELP